MTFFHGQNPKTKTIINYLILTLIVIGCTFITSLCHRILIVPQNGYEFVTGGFGGLGLIVAKMLILLGWLGESSFHRFRSTFCLLLNIPIIIIAFSFGFRFGYLTVLSIVCHFLFHMIFDQITLMQQLADYFIHKGELTRIVIASFIEGFGEATVIGIGASSGGIGTFAHYLIQKRQQDPRRLTSLIFRLNLIILSTYLILKTFEPHFQWYHLISSFIFAIMLSYTEKRFTDWHDFRGRKEQLQIITKKPDLLKGIMQQNEHGATVVNAFGGYTHEPEIIIYITVSVHETKNFIRLIQQQDPNCFINVVHVTRLHGHFLTRNFIN